MGQLRIIRSGEQQPPFNMALDDALLAAAGPPTLRLYGWQPAGLSLGYFQSFECFADVPGQHVVVRRATGGAAIYHSADITFALTLDLPSSDPGITPWYTGVHLAVKNALARFGIAVEFADKAELPGARSQSSMWCFAQPGPQDLVTPRGGKILGSAQRRIRRPRPRMLHHGCLVLRAPDATPTCGSVAELCDPTPIQEALEDEVVARIAEFLGLSPVNSAPTEAELRLADELSTGHHSDPKHLRRR